MYTESDVFPSRLASVELLLDGPPLQSVGRHRWRPQRRHEQQFTGHSTDFQNTVWTAVLGANQTGSLEAGNGRHAFRDCNGAAATSPFGERTKPVHEPT